ncbi:MAG: hypothetical protein CL916_07995 [Deltaproteobacteria bacterium]|nr:hypothetical protein [Deltaproteobacteria bacterium]
MIGMIGWLVPSLFAFSIEEGSYVCVQSQQQMEKRKKEALKVTLDSTNFMIRGMAESRLEGAPYMCRTYIIESLPNVMRVTCDAYPVIDIRLDGKPTYYPTRKDGGFSSVAKVKPKRLIQQFDASSGGFSVEYIQTQTGFDVVKSIYSPYLGEPLRVRASYVISKKENSQ